MIFRSEQIIENEVCDKTLHSNSIAQNATSSNMITNESLVQTEIVTICAADLPWNVYQVDVFNVSNEARVPNVQTKDWRVDIAGCVKATLLSDEFMQKISQQFQNFTISSKNNPLISATLATMDRGSVQWS